MDCKAGARRLRLPSCRRHRRRLQALLGGLRDAVVRRAIANHGALHIAGHRHAAHLRGQ